MGLYKRMSERLLPGSKNGARHLPSGDGTFFIYELASTWPLGEPLRHHVEAM